MKNLLALLSFILLLPSVIILNAQTSDDDPREEVSFGIKAGLNYSNVWDTKGEDFKAQGKVGLAGGLFLGIPFGEALGIQPEVLISQKGFKGSGTLLENGYSFKRTTTYIDFPIQLQIKPAEFLTLLVGPQYSYLVHQRDVYTFGSNSTAQEQEFNNDNIRKNILGFVTGADLIFTHIIVAPRAGLDLFNNNGKGSIYTPRYKNCWLQLAIGYKI